MKSEVSVECPAAPMKMTEDGDSVMGGIRMGVNVDIKRTDGKKHISICTISLAAHTAYIL